MPGGNCAKMDLHLLLEDYFTKKEQLERITAVLQEELLKVPNSEKLLAVKGIGIITVAGFLAEVGDLRRFTSPKQIQKLAGLEPKENSSGKHKGRTSISKRGRRKLRRLLFQAVLPLIRSNEDFREVYTYYSTRKDNPLKGTQAVIAVGCKLIRIFMCFFHMVRITAAHGSVRIFSVRDRQKLLDGQQDSIQANVHL